jgi:hypothetical protein
MKTATLKLETLHLIPGLAEDFDQQVAVMVDDCKKRPAIVKGRRIKLEIEIKPHPQDPDDVLIFPLTSAKSPSRAIDPIRGRRTRQGQLQFDFAEGGLEEE